MISRSRVREATLGRSKLGRLKCSSPAAGGQLALWSPYFHWIRVPDPRWVTFYGIARCLGLGACLV